MSTLIFDVSIKLVKNKEIVSNESFLYFLNKNTHDAYPEKDLRSFMTLCNYALFILQNMYMLAAPFQTRFSFQEEEGPPPL